MSLDEVLVVHPADGLVIEVAKDVVSRTLRTAVEVLNERVDRW